MHISGYLRDLYLSVGMTFAERLSRSPSSHFQMHSSRCPLRGSSLNREARSSRTTEYLSCASHSSFSTLKLLAISMFREKHRHFWCNVCHTSLAISRL
jgi:hypothetical protein